MNTIELSVILAAGATLAVYLVSGRRIGDTNTRRLWTLLGSTFIFSLVVLLITFKWVVK